MFYSTDILTKKSCGRQGNNHSLGVVWLAATLGTHSRRLTRRDYQAVNVVDAWQVVFI